MSTPHFQFKRTVQDQTWKMVPGRLVFLKYRIFPDLR